jgi:hypothetical protein
MALPPIPPLRRRHTAAGDWVASGLMALLTQPFAGLAANTAAKTRRENTRAAAHSARQSAALFLADRFQLAYFLGFFLVKKAPPPPSPPPPLPPPPPPHDKIKIPDFLYFVSLSTLNHNSKKIYASVRANSKINCHHCSTASCDKRSQKTNESDGRRCQRISCACNAEGRVAATGGTRATRGWCHWRPAPCASAHHDQSS